MGPLGEAHHALVAGRREGGREIVLAHPALRLRLVVARRAATGTIIDAPEHAPVDDPDVRTSRFLTWRFRRSRRRRGGSARSTASRSSASELARDTPIELPSRRGFTITGEAEGAVALLELGVGHVAGHVVVGGVGTLCRRKSSFALSLSIASALAITPSPCNGMPNPEQALDAPMSSPKRPWEREEGDVDRRPAQHRVDVAVDHDRHHVVVPARAAPGNHRPPERMETSRPPRSSEQHSYTGHW